LKERKCSSRRLGPYLSRHATPRRIVLLLLVFLLEKRKRGMDVLPKAKQTESSIITQQQVMIQRVLVGCSYDDKSTSLTV
jgi:hypothetical protein